MNRVLKSLLLVALLLVVNSPTPAGECQTQNLVGGWNEFSCPPPACPGDVCETWNTTQFGGSFKSCRCENTQQFTCR
ncbi:MAG: hypothetical protein AAGG01_18790, partial [Planctomycetota bacterium]